MGAHRQGPITSIDLIMYGGIRRLLDGVVARFGIPL